MQEVRTLGWTGALLGLVLALGACSGEVTSSDLGASQQQGENRVLDRNPEVARNPADGGTGALPVGGTASCVESYTAKALARRAFAFDGVVVEVGPSVSDRGGEADLGLLGVTFQVQEWFSGGRADTVTVDLQPSATDSAGPFDPGDAYGIGSRLLVSGEARWGGSPLTDPIAWGCGFTRYFDPETAVAWRDALTG